RPPCFRLFPYTTLFRSRSESILPAAAAHTLYNVVVFSGFAPPFLGKNFVQVALWAVGAYVLFHFWPVRVQGSLEPSPELSNLGRSEEHTSELQSRFDLV